MYGRYTVRNLNISLRDLRIWVEDEGFLRYHRKLGSEEIEKILVKDSEIIVNPVEPVNLPKNITNYLLIQFEKPILLEPVSSVEVFLTFPIEIGVFITKNWAFEDIDIFSLLRPKFALYGEPRGGVIARYWCSGVFSRIPKVDPLENGIIKLKIENLSDSWCEVTKAVFDVYGMKIYYSESLVSSIAELRVHSRRVAETIFVDKPLLNGMMKAIELYVAKKIPILSTKFTMEWGT
ncbi:MAG: DUF432 domain-containing protein [Archaeoglobaceae archaeon]